MLGILLLSSKNWANEPSYSHTALKEIMQKAALNSPEVLTKWHAFTAADAEIDVARSALKPKIDVTAGIGRERLRQPPSTNLDYQSEGLTFTLNQMLYDGFTSVGDVKRLGKAKLTRYFELLEAAEATAFEAAQAYYDVIRYRAMYQLAEQNYVEHRAVYEQLLQRALSGAGRRVDVEHAESRLALADINLSTEQANLHDVTARYMRIVNEAPPGILFGPGELHTHFPKSATEALVLAFNHNPTLRAAVENVEATQHDLAARRGAFQPRLDFRLRSDHNGNYQGVSGTRSHQVAELLLNYNLYNGGADEARQRQYAERRNLAFDLRDKACRDIRQTLVIAYNDVRRLNSQLGFLSVQVSAVERTRFAYREQFNIGQRSLLDVLDTENELLVARRTEINSQIDLSLAYLRTFAGMGRLLTVFGLKLPESELTPDETDFTAVPLTEICAAQAPSIIETDNNALTDRALKQIEKLSPTSDATQKDPMRSVPLSPTPTNIRAIPQPTPLSKLQTEKLLQERLNAWIAAWTARDSDALSAFYGPAFVPKIGLSQAAWIKQRTQPAAIKIQISELEISVEEGRATMKFLQHYTSETYRDLSRKSLEWVREGDRWLIQSETFKPERGRGDLKRENLRK